MPEDFNRLRLIVKTLVHTDFQRQWQFRLDIDGAPIDLDFYVKDISYSSREISTDEEQCGAVVLTHPSSINSVRISATMRDHMDERIRKWISSWMDLVVHKDGTAGLPIEYVRKVRKYIVAEDFTETLSEAWEMYPTTIGDLTQTREADEFLEFPVVFTQFKSE